MPPWCGKKSMRMGPDGQGNTTMLIMLKAEKWNQMIHLHISWTVPKYCSFRGHILFQFSIFYLIWIVSEAQSLLGRNFQSCWLYKAHRISSSSLRGFSLPRRNLIKTSVCMPFVGVHIKSLINVQIFKMLEHSFIYWCEHYWISKMLSGNVSYHRLNIRKNFKENFVFMSLVTKHLFSINSEVLTWQRNYWGREHLMMFYYYLSNRIF